jgi:hypothetical protein
MGRRFYGLESSEERPLQDRPAHEIAAILQVNLSQKLLARVLNLDDQRTVGYYARQEQQPPEDVEKNLRDFAHVTQVLLEQEGSADTVRAALVVQNPELNDQSIVDAFHNGEGESVVRVADQLLPN